MRLFYSLALVALAALASCGNGNGTASQQQPSQSTADSTSQAAPAKPRIADTITIAMNGDMMLGSLKPNRLLPEGDGKDLLRDSREITRGADVACGNLEGVLADDGTTRKAPGPLSFSFMMPTRYVNHLVDAGYDFMGIANNHIYDFWDAGTQSTIKTLREAGIGVAGTKDCESSIKEINGVKYGFCAFGHEDYSLKTQDTATVKRIITGLRPQCDILIVCFHGGAEGTNCRHVPHGKEYFHGMDRGDVHLIAYSLGNFCTLGMSTAAQTGYAPLLVARLDGNGKFVDGKIHSFIQGHRTGPRRDASNLVPKDIRALTIDDFKDNKLDIADDGTIKPKK